MNKFKGSHHALALIRGCPWTLALIRGRPWTAIEGTGALGSAEHGAQESTHLPERFPGNIPPPPPPHQGRHLDVCVSVCVVHPPG